LHLYASIGANITLMFVYHWLTNAPYSQEARPGISLMQEPLGIAVVPPKTSSSLTTEDVLAPAATSAEMVDRASKIDFGLGLPKMGDELT